MKKNQVKNMNRSWMAAFSVAITAFAAHAGGGFATGNQVSIPWWRSHPIHENRATESICTEPCNPLLRATKSMKRATSTY